MIDPLILSIAAIILSVGNLYLVLDLYSKLKIIPNLQGLFEVITTILQLLKTKARDEKTKNQLEEAEKLLKQVIEAIYGKEENT